MEETQQMLQQMCVSLRGAFKDIGLWRDADLRSNSFWTSKIKEALSGIGAPDECELRVSKRGENWEFLWDACFLELGGRPAGDGYFMAAYPLKRIIMAFEWEWDPRPREILYDFTKLLVSKAPLKVLVFWEPTLEAAEDILKQIQRAIEAFTQRTQDEHYLIAGITDETRAFDFRVFDGTGVEVPSLMC
ncbi:MAG: hypothetical protein M1398_03010 [Deltaproteobacteria bacterium]|nr:hypothetical protein [Deltaproteobacteria bacterium]